MKRTFLITATTIIAIFIFGAAICAHLFGSIYNAATTVEETTSELFFFSFEGNDGIESFIERGGCTSTQDVATFSSDFFMLGLINYQPSSIPVACSSLTVMGSEGNYLTGRNYDWPDAKGNIVVYKNKPTRGYASIATSAIDFYGFGTDYCPTESMTNRFMLICAAMYSPMDGMNEKGLYVADLCAGDHEVTNMSTGKKASTTTSMIRLLLDKAATTTEAIDIIKEYDMHSDIDLSLHIAIGDAYGECAVAEWVDNQLYVIQTPYCTNHYLSDSPKKNSSEWLEGSVERYNTLVQRSDSIGNLTTDDLRETLSMVTSKGMNRWSIVFDRNNLTATYYQYADFTKPIVFSIL